MSNAIKNKTPIYSESFLKLIKDILDTVSMTAIEYRITDFLEASPSEDESEFLRKLYGHTWLDLLHADCSELLGDHETAKRLRDFVAVKKKEKRTRPF